MAALDEANEDEFILLMGNKHSATADRDENDVVTISYQEAPQELVNFTRLPRSWSLLQCFQTITLNGGVYDAHFTEAPTWVECPEKPMLAEMLAEHFGCVVGKPADTIEETPDAN